METKPECKLCGYGINISAQGIEAVECRYHPPCVIEHISGDEITRDTVFPLMEPENWCYRFNKRRE